MNKSRTFLIFVVNPRFILWVQSTDCLTDLQEINVSSRIKRVFTAKFQKGGLCDLQGQKNY